MNTCWLQNSPESNGGSQGELVMLTDIRAEEPTLSVGAMGLRRSVQKHVQSPSRILLPLNYPQQNLLPTLTQWSSNALQLPDDPCWKHKRTFTELIFLTSPLLLKETQCNCSTCPKILLNKILITRLFSKQEHTVRLRKHWLP